MKTISIATAAHRSVIDITADIERTLPDNFCGLVHIHALHTTCAITTADLDPGTDLDLLDALSALKPHLTYRHPHNPDPSHVGDHIMSSLIGPSILIPADQSRLMLGHWQRLVLIELDGPRERSVVVSPVVCPPPGSYTLL